MVILHKHTNQGKKQEMRGIKAVIQISDRLIIRTLLSAIEPNGNEREHGECLHHKLKGLSEKHDGDKLSADDLDADEIKANNLPQKRPPFSLSEKIKHQDDQDTAVVIIHKGDDAEQTAEQYRTDENEDTDPKRLFVCFFVEENEKDTDEERPKHVLMQGRYPRA